MKSIASLLAGILFLFAGCSVYSDVQVTSEPSVNWKEYRSFAWLPDQVDTAQSPYNNQIIRNNIRNYFGKALAERGFVLENNTPDLLLQIVVDHKKQEREFRHYIHPAPFYFHRYYLGSDYYFPYPPDYYYTGHNLYCYPYGYCVEKVTVIHGAIALNMIDRKTNRVLWSGKAQGDIFDPSYINRSIHPAVEAIMKRFPVKPICCTEKGCRREHDDLYIPAQPVVQ